MKTCWVSLTIRGMQIKTAMKYHFTPTRVAKDIEKLEPLLLLVWTENSSASLENGFAFPQNVQHTV
jgi:hypothetical protein